MRPQHRVVPVAAFVAAFAVIALAGPRDAAARRHAVASPSATATRSAAAMAPATAPPASKPSAAPAAAKPPTTGASPPAASGPATGKATTTPTAASDNAAPSTGTPDTGGADEVTRYTFTGLDIDGELRTPALLQFLARIGGEFETVGIPHRSFMPELASTTSEDAL